MKTRISKKSFDPDFSIRTGMLNKCPFESAGLEVRVAGSTTFDYIETGKHKGSNILLLLEHTGWRSGDCLYFGDRLLPGGNDESVIGIIDTQEVKNHTHTLELLKKYFV